MTMPHAHRSLSISGTVHLAVALMIPLLGLGVGWAVTDKNAQLGTDWDIPVTGYDPRDLLRGHYITYRYQWPGIDPGDELDRFERLCIEGSSPTASRVSVLTDGSESNCASTVRASAGDRREIRGLATGILYVPQTEATQLEQKLTDPNLQGIIRIRVREDGVLRPLHISFVPRD